jgi:hypothetical protein
MPAPKFPFLADATGIAVATGQGTLATVNTSAYVRDGVYSAGLAHSSAAATTPPGGAPQPSASAFADASALGGNLNVSMTGSFSGGTPGETAYQSAYAYESSTLALGSPTLVTMAPLQTATNPISLAPTGFKPASSDLKAAVPVSTNGNSASADLTAAASGTNATTSGAAAAVAVQDQYSAVNAAVTAGVA